MKHCILAKFTPEAKAQRAALLPRIREIFSAAADIPGVHGAEVIPNCVDRDNRYDVLIRLDMDREALPLYDVSAMPSQTRPRWVQTHPTAVTGGPDTSLLVRHGRSEGCSGMYSPISSSPPCTIRRLSLQV